MNINVITAYIGDNFETPLEGYGSTEPKQKGYNSGSQLFDERCEMYKAEQPRSNNEARVNGRMVRSGMSVAGWSY